MRFKDHPILHIKLPFIDASVTEAFKRSYTIKRMYFCKVIDVHSAASSTRRERFEAHSKNACQCSRHIDEHAYINQHCMHVMRRHSSRYSGDSGARHLTALLLKGLKSRFEDSINLLLR